MVEFESMGLGRVGTGRGDAFQWFIDSLVWTCCIVYTWSLCVLLFWFLVVNSLRSNCCICNTHNC